MAITVLVVAALLGLILGAAAGPIWAVFLSVFAVVSVLPIVIAFARNHRNRAPITVLTLFLGWTFLGWVAALVWSFTSNIEDDQRRERAA